MAAPNLNAFLSALFKGVQTAENALTGTMISRILGFASDKTLDALGRVVGEQRYGRLDDAYRKAIRLRIYINSSRGTPEDYKYIARQMTGFQVVTYFDVPSPAGNGGNFRLVIAGWTPDDGTLLRFLQSICPAGVRILGVTDSYVAGPFRMGDRMGTRLVTY